VYYIVKRTCILCKNVKMVKCPDSHDIVDRMCDRCARNNRPRIRKFNNNGYVTFAQKYVHRILWEKHYGKIPNGYVIHHKNNVRHDNRIENLELLPKRIHDMLTSIDYWDGVKIGKFKPRFNAKKKIFDTNILWESFLDMKTLRKTAKLLSTSKGTIKRYLCKSIFI